VTTGIVHWCAQGSPQRPVSRMKVEEPSVDTEGARGVADDGSDQDRRDGAGGHDAAVRLAAGTVSLARSVPQFIHGQPRWLMSHSADRHRARPSGPPPFPLRSRGPARRRPHHLAHETRGFLHRGREEFRGGWTRRHRQREPWLRTARGGGRTPRPGQVRPGAVVDTGASGSRGTHSSGKSRDRR
jgi:hypothetical protein